MSESVLPTRSVIYVRISDDRGGEALGVGRQEADARALAERLGWGVMDEVIVENDTSAFKRKRVKVPGGRTQLRVIRPGFRRVIDLLDSGAADGLIAYDLDRTARDPRDLEDLIDVVESRTPPVSVRSVTGSLRLDNDADVTMARVMVAVANKSSRDTARRVSRKNDELAQAGVYAGGGARRYGYAKDGMTLIEGEVEVIREMVARVLDGESVNAICKDLNARDVRPVKAARWSTQTVIGILRSGRIAGLREHRGEVVGPAAWPAVIDAKQRIEVLARLEALSHGRGKMPLRYWCGWLLWCGRCDGPLTGGYNGLERHRYWCATNREPAGCGRIAISGTKVEAWVTEQVFAYLDRPDVAEALAVGTERVATSETRRLMEDDDRALRELAEAYGQKQIGMAEWLQARAPIDKRLKVYSQALRAVLPPTARRVLAADDREAAWAALSPFDKRDLVRTLLATGGYDGWTVAPADTTKARAFDPERLTLRALSEVPASITP